MKLQEYIDDYPDSPKRDEAQNAIISIRNKLSRKVYESGILYMKLEEYKAALLSFDKIIFEPKDLNKLIMVLISFTLGKFFNTTG